MSKKKNCAYIAESFEEICFKNSPFGQDFVNELKEMDKHEIIVNICEQLGSNPCNLTIAEEIFEKIKFDIARYIIHHEYSCENDCKSKLLLWLDCKTSPEKAECLSDFVNRYLR